MCERDNRLRFWLRILATHPRTGGSAERWPSALGDPAIAKPARLEPAQPLRLSSSSTDGLRSPAFPGILAVHSGSRSSERVVSRRGR